ncbi:MAG: hypothetical protein KBS54_00825, partial [Synergistaceae bacterium]|nr:hypothetical protein [Candidatus Equadaptatus faecalis]
MLRTKIRKIAAVLMLVSFIFATVSPAMALTPGGLKKITEIEGGGGASKNIGTETDPVWVASDNAKTIYFGNYWQTLKSGAPSASEDLRDYNYEGIKWRVLSNDQTGTGTKQVFLMSDQGLYADQFNSSVLMGNKWSTSEVRATLTGLELGAASNTVEYADLNTPSFAYDAFNAKEYAAIADTTHTAGGDCTGKDIESTDKLFLLSYEEVNNTDYGFENTDLCMPSDTRRAPATEMAQHVKMYGNTKAADVDDGNSYWWLRSPGDGFDFAYGVIEDGVVIYDHDMSDDFYVDYAVVAARAALNLNQESVLLLSAAVGGKGADACVGAFGLDNTYEGENGWKLTLKDAYNATTNPTGIKAPTNVSVTQTMTGGVDALAEAADEGGTIDLTSGVTVEYSAPVVKYTAQAITDGKANYVSGIVANSAGDYVNYAKISDQASETGKEVGFGTLADGTYKMYVYAEQANGDKETDYASDFSNTDGYEFTKGSTTAYEGTLSTGYATKALTANLGGDFNLSFENDTYNTGVTVGEGETGTITADATGGTTLTGKITVEENATLTTANKFTLKGDNTVDGTVTGGALTIAGGKTTVNETGSIENDVTIQTAGTVKAEGKIANATVKEGGTLELNADKYGVTGGVENAALDGGTLNLTGGTLTKAVTGGNLNVNGDVTSKADYIAGDTNTVTADNILTLSAGALAKAITGEGTTKIAGDVTTNAKVSTTAYTIGTAGNLTTDAQYIGTAIDNSGIVNLTAGTLTKAITGEGTTKIAGDVTAEAAIATVLTVDTAGELTTSADNLGGDVTNSGTLNLTAGTLAKAISGEGTTKITGDVTAEAAIATALTVDTTGELTTSADNLGGDVTNSGIVNFTGGTLAKNYTSTGTTNFKDKTTFSGEVSLTNSTVNFYLDGFKAGDTIVTSDKAVALDNAEIGLYQIIDTEHKLTQKGDKITLISSAEGYGYTEEAPNLIDVQGGMVEDTYGVYQSTTGALEAAYIESGLIDQTKSFSEARLAGSAAINSASDLVASAVIENATAEAKDWEAFAAIQGSHSRYETGSHIDLNSTNVAAGLS